MLTQGPIILRSKLDVFISIIASLVYLLIKYSIFKMNNCNFVQ